MGMSGREVIVEVSIARATIVFTRLLFYRES